ncbi:MAG: C39 family peptidase [Labilithrix sp.]|nr:C39 family peptidase [Labilithrix sp.]MCW5810775.1 C39 family peptidase [Labilithrix sp.]
MAASLWKGLVVGVFAAFALVGCATEVPDEDVDDGESVGTTDDELRSSPLDDKDMVEIPKPEGMPDAWKQPKSTGRFEQGGKCGPTALANMLRLHDIELSPEEADKAGVRWVVGTLQWQIDSYLKRNHRELGCRTSYPWNGAKALRNEIAAGRPVMVWYNTDGALTSHWVVAVGIRGSGSNEKVIVMSWGKYYEIPMKKLDDASKWVYGLRHPTVICSATTDNVVR